LIERTVVLKLVGEVEDQVRREALQLLAQQVEIVKNHQVLGGVAEGAERRQDVGFGLPVLGLQLSRQVLVDRRGAMASNRARILSERATVTWCV